MLIFFLSFPVFDTVHRFWCMILYLQLYCVGCISHIFFIMLILCLGAKLMPWLEDSSKSLMNIIYDNLLTLRFKYKTSFSLYIRCPLITETFLHVFRKFDFLPSSHRVSLRYALFLTFSLVNNDCGSTKFPGNNDWRSHYFWVVIIIYCTSSTQSILKVPVSQNI